MPIINKNLPGDKKSTAWLILLCGVLLGLAYPPLPLGVFAFVAFIPFFILFENITGYRKGLWTAYKTLFIFNLLTLYWTGGFTQCRDLYLMIAGAAVLLFHPIFHLIVLVPFIFLRKHFGHRKAVLLFPCIWVSFEYFDSLTEYSFPWLDLGNTQTSDLPAIQFASITGVYGVTFWILAINVLLYLLGKTIAEGRWGLRSPRAIVSIAGILLLYLLPKVAGRHMMHQASSVSEKPLSVSVIQPNIDPFEKWTDSPERQMEIHDSLTQAAAVRSPDLVLWSETAIPFFILYPSAASEFSHLRNMVDSLHINLLSGAPDRFYYPSDRPAPKSSKTGLSGRQYDDYNSSILLQAGRNEIQTYRKIRLVPYAERVPYSEFLSFLNAMQWNFGLGGWGIGKDTTIFYFQDRGGRTVRFANFICYESIFPGFDAAFVRKGAEFITVITNDSWWGNTSGAYQHEQIGVLRAIENRRWLVQCANGGISFVIDPYGRIVAETPMYSRVILTTEIFPLREETFYTRTGDWFPEGCLAVVLSMVAAAAGNAFYRRARRLQQADAALDTGDGDAKDIQ